MVKKITIEFDDDWGNGYYGNGYTESPFQYPRYNDPCRYCSNNPRNNPHASGVCNCALPALANPMFM